jgi:hypothetical protein
VDLGACGQVNRRGRARPHSGNPPPVAWKPYLCGQDPGYFHPNTAQQVGRIQEGRYRLPACPAYNQQRRIVMKATLSFFLPPLAAYLLVAQGCSTAPSGGVASNDTALVESKDGVAEGAIGHILDLKAAPAIQRMMTHSRRRTWSVGE